MENIDLILKIDSVIWEAINKKKKLKYVENDEYTIEELIERWEKIKTYRKQLNKLLKVPKIEQRTQRWYDARSSIITASNFIEAIKKTPSFIVKKAANDSSNFGKTAACEWGTKYEPVACDIYRMVNNNIGVNDFGLILDTDIKCIGASPDGITDMGVMLEIKCPYSRDISNKKIKNEYWCQIQGQLAVCKLKECDFSQFKFKEFKVLDEFLEFACNYNYFGVIAVNNEGYEYSSIGTDSNDIQDILSFINLHEGLLLNYWVLEDYNIQRVCFDEIFWNETLLPALLECWECIKNERDRYLPDGFLKDD